MVCFPRIKLCNGTEQWGKHKPDWNNFSIGFRLWIGFCNLSRGSEIQRLIISDLKPYFIRASNFTETVLQQEKCNPTTDAGTITFTQYGGTGAITLWRRRRFQRKQTSIQFDTDVIISTGAVLVRLRSLCVVFLLICWQECLCQQHRYVQRCKNLRLAFSWNKTHFWHISRFNPRSELWKLLWQNVFLQGIYCGASLLKCHVKAFLGISNFKNLLFFFFLSGTWIISLQKSPKLPRVIGRRSTVLWFVLCFLSFFTPSTDQRGWDSFWGSWESLKWKIIFVLNLKFWSMIWRQILFDAASVFRAQHRQQGGMHVHASTHFPACYQASVVSLSPQGLKLLFWQLTRAQTAACSRFHAELLIMDKQGSHVNALQQHNTQCTSSIYKHEMTSCMHHV